MIVAMNGKKMLVVVASNYFCSKLCFDIVILSASLVVNVCDLKMAGGFMS